MNIEINIDRQPVAARSMAVKQISAADMLRRTIDELHKANDLNDRLIADNKRLILDNTAQLERIVSLRQRNEQLWDSYIELRKTLKLTTSDFSPTSMDKTS